jgi:hypothetical protein
LQPAEPSDICYGAGQESRILAAVQQKQMFAINGNLISRRRQPQPPIEALGIDGFKLPGKAPRPGASSGPGEARHAGDCHRKMGNLNGRWDPHNIEPAPSPLKRGVFQVVSRFELLVCAAGHLPAMIVI